MSVCDKLEADHLLSLLERCYDAIWLNAVEPVIEAEKIGQGELSILLDELDEVVARRRLVARRQGSEGR